MSKQENKWSCPRCTYDNFFASNKCVLCKHPQDSELIQPPPATSDADLVITNYNTPDDSSQTNSNSLIICPPATLVEQKRPDAKTNNDNVNSSGTLSGNPVQTVAEEKQSDSSVQWACSACTFLNAANTALCTQCETKKSESTTLGEKPQNSLSLNNNKRNKKWTCSACTYENWVASKFCVVCRLEAKTSQEASNADLSGTSVPCASISVKPLDEAAVKRTSTSACATPDTSTLQSSSGLSQKGSSSKSQKLDTFLDPTVRSGSSSNSSSRSHSPRDDSENHGQSRSQRRRRNNLDNQACSSRTVACSSKQQSNSPLNLSRSGSSGHLYSLGRIDIVDNRTYKNRSRNTNWLFLKACIGVVDGNIEAVDAYLMHGGNIARTLTADEINCLNRPSAFDTGHTLVHLAIRFQRHNILRLLLTPEVAPRAFKRNPAHLSPDIAELIRREIAASLRTKKGDLHCRFLSEFTTFQLPIEICDLPASIQKLLFNELLDQDVQKELEEEGAINWSSVLLRYGECSNRLYSLWNRSAGDCLLDSVLQATWGVFDRDNVLRSALSESLEDCATSFFRRWCEWEHYQADLLGYSLTERQCLHDWAVIHSLAQQPGASLEHCHIFVLSHILRRPIIVYGIKYLKSFRGETLGFAKFQGVYLPFLWDQSFCYTSPISLGYTRGHFTALVTMENSVKDICASSRHHYQPFNTVKYLPLVDSDGKILPIHFTTRTEAVSEEQRKEILHEWLDCHVTESGVLMAVQRPGKRPPTVTRLVDSWLDHYRHLSFRRLGEEGCSDDDDE